MDRSLQLLDALADLGGMASLSDLVAHTNLPVATIHRLIGTMRDAGYVRQEANRHYALGVRLYVWGERRPAGG
ncbi:MAG: helix-turn-helix domain-containing protein [Lawsonella clevelandensis]